MIYSELVVVKPDKIKPDFSCALSALKSGVSPGRSRNQAFFVSRRHSLTKGDAMNEKFVHTAGPWVSDKYGAIVGSDGNNVVFSPGFSIGSVTGHPESKLNTQLAMAAPELVEALMEAVDCGMVPISSASEGGASKFSRQVIVADMIRAAIAKATGKTSEAA